MAALTINREGYQKSLVTVTPKPPQLSNFFFFLTKEALTSARHVSLEEGGSVSYGNGNGKGLIVQRQLSANSDGLGSYYNVTPPLFTTVNQRNLSLQ